LLTRGYVGGRLSPDLISRITLADINNLKASAESTGRCAFLKPRAVSSSILLDDRSRHIAVFMPADEKPPNISVLLEDIKTEMYEHEVFQVTGKRPDRRVSSLSPTDATFSILSSEISKHFQMYHTDYPLHTTSEFLGISSVFYEPESDRIMGSVISDIPLVCLIAVEDSTKLFFVPGSHRVLLRQGEYKFAEENCFILNKGEYLIFHPLLVHYGAAYELSNTRLHIYCDSKRCPRYYYQSDNTPATYPIDIDEPTGKFGDESIVKLTPKKRTAKALEKKENKKNGGIAKRIKNLHSLSS